MPCEITEDGKIVCTKINPAEGLQDDTPIAVDDIVSVRFGTLCTDIMAAIHYGANDRECIVKDVAAMKASEFVKVMVEEGHINRNS